MNGECLDLCPNGYYANVLKSTCDLCDVKCATCYNTGFDNCFTCTVGYFYLDNACIDECG